MPTGASTPRVGDNPNAANHEGGEITPIISRGFRGRRADAPGDRVPPGQYVTRDFPVLSAGPTPHTSLEHWDFSIGGEVDNGAFFAGLELIEHQPHSLYIDRYPLGREATISWGGPELIFRNDWPASLLIRLATTETSVTVRFFSSGLGRRVETETSAPYGNGGGSFQVEYTRRVYRGSRLTRDERFRVRYGVSAGSGPPAERKSPHPEASPVRTSLTVAAPGESGLLDRHRQRASVR
jgi:VanW like protein